MFSKRMKWATYIHGQYILIGGWRARPPLVLQRHMMRRVVTPPMNVD